MARRIVSILVVYCYLLATVGSVVWHDHAHVHHNIPDSNANETVTRSHCGHGATGSHYHAHAVHNHENDRSRNNQQPKPIPLHDDDCVVCQYFAEQPVETQSVCIVSTEKLFEQVVISRAITTTACIAQLPLTRGPPC